jgi:serine/threonine protein phosphatase PrpC
MRLDVFDPSTPSRILQFVGEAQNLVVVVDGSASWGNGQEAAALGMEYLETLWKDTARWSVSQVAEGIVEAGARTPASLRDELCGCGYSVAALLCSAETVACVAAGLYRVDVLGRGARIPLYRPKRLIDQLVSSGEVSREEAASYPEGEIYVGSYVGDSEAAHLESPTHTVRAGEVVVVCNDVRVNLEPLTGKVPPVRARAVALECGLVPDPGPIVLAML